MSTFFFCVRTLLLWVSNCCTWTIFLSSHARFNIYFTPNSTIHEYDRDNRGRELKSARIFSTRPHSRDCTRPHPVQHFRARLLFSNSYREYLRDGCYHACDTRTKSKISKIPVGTFCIRLKFNNTFHTLHKLSYRSGYCSPGPGDFQKVFQNSPCWEQEKFHLLVLRNLGTGDGTITKVFN